MSVAGVLNGPRGACGSMLRAALHALLAVVAVLGVLLVAEYAPNAVGSSPTTGPSLSYDATPNLALATAVNADRSRGFDRPVADAAGPSLASSVELSAPRAADGLVDLTTASRRNHIQHGNATGGGHLYPGLAGKSSFPQSWSPDRVLHEISDIATDPTAWKNAIGQGDRTVLTGTRGGVDIRVIIDTPTGEIITGYPTSIPRNTR